MTATPSMKSTRLVSLEPSTMSSVDIAKISDKRHDHVKRDIEKMLCELVIGLPKFGGTYLTKQGKQSKCYHLPKRECLILVSGYSLKLRTKIIDRWQELEERHPTLPKTLPEALRLYADAVEENTALKPKALALDRLYSAEGNHSLRDTAKQLGIKQKVFFDWLKSNRWCFKNGKGERVPYQQRLDSGLMATRGGENNGHSFIQPLITPKGLTKLSLLLGGDSWPQ